MGRKGTTIYSMRRVLPFLLLSAVVLCGLFSPAPAQALELSGQTHVTAAVGAYYLSVSGYIAPYASIVLTSNGVFYRATVAGPDGRFSISQVLINKGFSSFCLEALDYKRLGSSFTCFNVPPATGDIVKKDIFLPPTLGVQKTEIAAGSDALAYGYTMPGAKVTLYLDGVGTLTTTADSSGYYEFIIKKLQAGNHHIYAIAVYKGIPSVKPSRQILIKALSTGARLQSFWANFWKALVQLFTSLGLGPLWLILPLLVAITLLILKLWPERFSSLYQNRLLFFFNRRRDRKLHHAWFVGY